MVFLFVFTEPRFEWPSLNPHLTARIGILLRNLEMLEEKGRLPSLRHTVWIVRCKSIYTGNGGLCSIVGGSRVQSLGGQ